MTDIVARLRAACNGYPHAEIAWPHRLLHEAADKIEHLLPYVEAFRREEKRADDALAECDSLRDRIKELEK